MTKSWQQPKYFVQLDKDGPKTCLFFCIIKGLNKFSDFLSDIWNVVSQWKIIF